jgi:hypothetical protein
MKNNSFVLLFLLLVTGMSQGQGQALSLNTKITEPYPVIKARFTGNKVPESPDPLVDYKWPKTSADDDLEIYILHPVSIVSDVPGNVQYDKNNILPITINGVCNLIIDFGRENAGWLEFDSDDFDGKVEMSISEFNEPAVFNTGSQHPKKTLAPIRYGSTYRLELNRELYEGVRFGWIHIKSITRPFTINDVRLVCQVKPTNYEGSFSSSDTMLTRMWYTGAYTVKLNLQKNFFGAILMERSDRISWTGDAYPAQAASMVAFGNYDFVRKNLFRTSNQSNSIASYPLYWVLSLVDYCNYTGDKTTLNALLENACRKLDAAYTRFDHPTGLRFNGWDERLGAGFENPDYIESQYVYRTLSIQAWKEFSRLMRWLGRNDFAKKYGRFADEKMDQIRLRDNWYSSLGIHSASNLVNAGVTQSSEQELLWKSSFSDRQQRLSLSPFNQFFIIQAMARMGKYEEALTTIDDCWGGQLRYGGTSFFEVYRPSWNDAIGRNGAPINFVGGYTSLAHPWSAGITKWLNEEILGIRPTTPGFATFSVMPRLASGVEWVKGVVPTQHCNIELLCNTKSGKMMLTVPDKTLAKVGIPKTGLLIGNIKVNGKNITPSGEDKDFVNIGELPSGQYDIKFQPDKESFATPQEIFGYLYKPATEDTVTQGSWKGKYGNKGFFLCNYDSINGHRQKLPDFVGNVAIRQNGDVQLSKATDDPRALVPDAIKDARRRIGAVITKDPASSRQTMTVDISCKQNIPYQVALYMVDWEKEGRRSAIEVYDLNNKALLMPVKLIRDYQKGKYVVLNVDRSIRIRICQVRGPNASLSALFLD